MENLFVTIEGIDGAGKSTVVDAIKKNYKSVSFTKEPSGLWTGDCVYRSIESDDTNPFTDFYLFMADRAYHIDTLIEPALEKDMMVVSDRFADSTRAYQFHALNEELPGDEEYTEEYIDELMTHWNIEPDLTIYLDISIETSIERCGGEDKYEQEEFLRNVKSRYEYLREKYDYRYVTVDGEQSKEAVKEEVVEIIEDRSK